MNGETLLPEVWRDRCARRIAELDSQLSESEARELAAEFQAFERTRVMAPEEAADFVVGEMMRADSGRFERRARERLPVAP